MITVPFNGNLNGFSTPRSIVRLDGNNTYFNSWTVNLNSTHHADDFKVDLPFRIDRNQPQSYLINTPDFTSYLFTNSDILVEIYSGYPPDPDHYTVDDLTRIMYGYLDDVTFSGSASGETVSLTGRNMIGIMLDSKTTEKYQNMTSSAIVQMIAARHNLQASVTPTYTLTGSYYNGDSIEINKDISEWDLLAFLAEQEGFELRVMDNTLYFGPFNTVIGNLANTPLVYTWGQNVEELQIQRSFHAAKNLIVEVHSYSKNKNTGKHIMAQAKRSYTHAKDSYYERYFFPGLTQDQAQQKAQSILDQLSKLEVMGDLKVSGNNLLTVDRQIQLYGVGIGLSQNYYVRKATHRFDYTNGYRTDVSFSNLLLPDQQTGGI